LFTVEEEKKKPLNTDSMGSDIPTCSGICTKRRNKGGFEELRTSFSNMMSGFPLVLETCLVNNDVRRAEEISTP